MPRDALITLSSPRSHLGEAFGVHRALDTAGALLGPIVAFVLLAAVPGRYDAVFLTSFCAAVLGLSRPGPLRPEPCRRTATSPARRARVSLRSAMGLLRQPGFRALVLAGTALALVTIGDAFVYLVLQRRSELDARFFPLLYVGTAFVFLTLAIPAGRLADRYGRQRMFLAGYVLLLAAYLVLLLPAPGLVAVTACLAPARRLLRGHRRRPDGARRCDLAVVARRQRDRAPHHRDRARPPGGSRRVRRAVELGRSGSRGDRVRAGSRSWRSSARRWRCAATRRTSSSVRSRLVAFALLALASVAVPALYVLRARIAPDDAGCARARTGVTAGRHGAVHAAATAGCLSLHGTRRRVRAARHRRPGRRGARTRR